MVHRRALVRRPSPRLHEGIVDHIERVPVDYALAVEQWQQYVAVLLRYDWQTIEVPRADDCPDGVFIEDTMVVYRNVALISRPGAPSRRPEIVDAEPTVERLGLTIERVREPGTLDGGDVLKVGTVMYVGRSDRTNAEGVAQLRRTFEPQGVDVVEVPVRKVLHLKSAVTALPNGAVIGYPPLMDDASIFPTFIPVPEPAGAHVVLLGENRLLMAASAPASAELFAGLGYEPIIVDISEYEKLEGCVTCLSVRLRGEAG
ncbi:MAG TPA: N(G),N(G)-dimethylarginine dimethylaminohydrolase [Steroidobacteraceae bacterium]|jgi:dimethylargininase|nr:N(G),N(G)-dimethylarginine dimethylaminohydrolase [Steroidobacteraceae bacterium]